MTFRIAFSLIVVGAVAFACNGRRARTEAASPIPTATVVAAQLAGNPAPRTRHVDSASGAAVHSPLDTRFAVDVEPGALRFSLDVKNATDKHIEVNFKNGQTYDFVVTDTVGRVLWRWGAKRMFTQTMQNRQLGKGDVMHIDATWNRPPTAGRFIAIAVLNSSNYPAQRRVSFEIPDAESSLASR